MGVAGVEAASAPARRALPLPLAWWALVVVFFTIPGGKRDMYILPALPMACLALAPLLPGIVRKAWAQRLAFGFTAVLAGASAAGGAGDVVWRSRLRAALRRSRAASKVSRPRWPACSSRSAAWGVGCLLWFGRRRAIAAMLATLAGLWVLFGLVGMPLLNDSSSARGLMTEVGQRIGPDAELGLVAWREQNLLRADRPAQTFGFKVPFDEQMRRGLAWQAQQPERRWLLVQEVVLAACVDRSARGAPGPCQPPRLVAGAGRRGRGCR